MSKANIGYALVQNTRFKMQLNFLRKKVFVIKSRKCKYFLKCTLSVQLVLEFVNSRNPCFPHLYSQYFDLYNCTIEYTKDTYVVLKTSDSLYRSIYLPHHQNILPSTTCLAYHFKKYHTMYFY